eukprot:Hpha_TRINITY_DN16212_c1_g2::TRINITY_DN16212_c1_g2_i1::g.13090::m.13090
MCSAQDLADLRADLSALVGDCELLGGTLQDGYERLGRRVRGLGQRLATLDETSSFGYDLKDDLSITRFEEPRPETFEEVKPDALPPHLRTVYEIMADAAELCRETASQDLSGGFYIDTEHTSHELEDAPELPTIAIGLEDKNLNEKSAERRTEEKEKLERNKVDDAIKRLFIWRRPNQIYPAYGIFPQGNKLLDEWPSCIPMPPALLPHLETFTPGPFDDSWLVLAISTIATHRHLFQRLFVSCDFADYGMFAFQFCDVTAGEDPTIPTAAQAQRGASGTGDRRWRSVVIDAHIPLMLERETLVPTFGRTGEETALWLVYIMKAYAKWRGSYSYLHSGDTARACAEFTGGRARTELWNPQKITPESVCVMWWKLCLCNRLGLLAICANMPNRVDSGNIETDDDEEFGEKTWTDGEQVVLAAELPASLTTEHLGVRMESGLKLIKLRNLRGKPTSGNGGQWDWGPASAKWKDKRVRQYFSYTRMHECVGWVGIEDFVRHYNTLLTVSCWEGAPYVNFSTLLSSIPGQGPCHAHQYLVSFDLQHADAGVTLSDDALMAVASTSKALYDPPDFRTLERDEQDEEDMMSSPGLSRPDQEAKGCRIKVFISQPNLQAMDGKLIARRPILFHVFRLQQRRLQAPEVRGAETAEDSDDGADEPADGAKADIPPPIEEEEQETTKKVLTEYFWPRYNLVELATHPVRDSCGSQEKNREYDALEQSFSFVVTQPGLYSVAIEQENPQDEIEYCFEMQTEEVTVANPSGLIYKCEYGGTHADPLIRPELSTASRHASVGSFTVSRSRGQSIGISDTMTETSPRTRGSQVL